MNTFGNICQDLANTVMTYEIIHFFQDLASQVLKCYMFLQFHVPKSWQWLHYSRLGVPSLELPWLGLPRHEHKWTWLSRLGSHRSDSSTCLIQDLLGVHFFETLHVFAIPCPQVLTMIALFKDLAFQVLKLFGVKNFNIRPLPRIMFFHDLVLQDMNTFGNICQDLADQGRKSFF